MIVRATAISQADAAVMLRVKLGDLRSWQDFLADNIRGRQELAGLTLLPCGQVRGPRGCLRPVYSLQALNDFVEKVKAAVPGAGKKPIKTIVLAIDTGRGWKSNTFDEYGLPLAKARCVSARHLNRRGGGISPHDLKAHYAKADFGTNSGLPRSRCN